MLARAALRTATNLLYPPVCQLCDDPLDTGGEMICVPCRKNVEPICPPFCSICGEGFAGEMTAIFRCPNCGDREFDFDFAVAPWKFSGTVRMLLLALKYGKKSHLRRVIAEFTMAAFEDERLAESLDEKWKIVPVPLNSRKFREREFNQSEEIADILATQTGYPVLDVLARTRYTPSQARLTRKERMENIEGAFSFRKLVRGAKSIAGNPVFLFDDVFTTGATSQECARILKEDGGASRVVVLTVARG